MTNTSTTTSVLDRVLEVAPGERARALKAVPNTWSILDSHFPLFPVLPGVLLLEAMAATAAEALQGAAGDRRAWRLTGIEGARFRHFVRPGDLVEIEASVTAAHAETATCKIRAAVAGSVVATVKVLRLVDERGGSA
jgi:3-hydroxyacyl-[acyl-carrier-protein] dehydratase